MGRARLALDGIRFVTTEASRRPQMAFVSFTREVTREAPMHLNHDSSSDAPESIEQTVPHPKGPRLVKADPDDDRG